MSDTHMEELVAHAGAMATGEHGGARYHGDALLAPDTDFMTDDRSSATSGLDVSERLTYLEQRVQMQEDEIQLLKMALADVLKRLNISEEQQAALNKKAPAKASRPASLALPPRPSTTSSAAPVKKSSSTTLPSSGGTRNYTPSSSSKRSSVMSAKDSPGTPSKPRSSTTTTSVTCKKVQDRKPGATVAGTRRVIHCKVTMQIYLSRLSKRTGSSEEATPSPLPSNHTQRPPPPKSPPPGTTGACDRTKPLPLLPSPRQAPPLTLHFQKAPCQSSASFSPLGTPTYVNPIKSASHYFQICY